MEGITRRGFLAGTMALVGVGAVAGLSGCTGSDATGTDDSAGADSASQLVDVTEDMVKSTEDCDIVVCGSGTAGTYAAVRAAENGAKVIWLEKNDSKGGTSVVTEGVYSANSKLQTAAGKDATPMSAFYDPLQEFQQYGAVPEVVRSVFENSGPAVDWAMEHGAHYTFKGDSSAPSVMCFDENGKFMNTGAGVLKPLWAYGDTLSNLDSRTGTPAVNIIYEDGKVAGVYAKDDQDEIIRINAKAVIMCTGGFGSNMAMKEQRLRVRADRVEIAGEGLSNSTGDGINMAVGAGAVWNATSSLGYGYTRVKGSTWDNMLNIAMMRPQNSTYKEKPLPVVNQDGKHFWNESGWTRNNMVDFNIAVANQFRTYVICDETFVARWDSVTDFDHMTGITHGVLRDEMQKSDAVVSADTLEELAEKINVDPDNFVESMRKWNAVYNGEETDDEYNLNRDNMNPVQTGPFYASEFLSMAWSTCAGIRTDGRFRAIDAEGNPIDGLYVCGNDNGSLYYNDYPYAVIGGLQQGSAIAAGFGAADDACANL